MDIKDLRLLIKIVTETDINEFEMESGEEKIRIRRGITGTVQYQPSQQVISFPQPVQAQAPSIPAGPAQAAPAVAAEVELEAGKSVTSPIVGTFYRAPAPDAPPYVEVGQVVEKGQVFCIVEAMKLMNEIEAEFRCKIIKICKENAQPVEFGDTLFLVEPL